ncbi:MAG: hypothetical protein HY513_05710 [Candidatus Aenigmarchaeota archaeon]|nr:hypothetical protein [Candidatus Aenigmarchaeota archaeon]
MNDEKYPNSFIIIFSIYLAVFAISFFGFFLPSLALNLWSDSGYFWIILTIFLPLIAAGFYSKSSRFQFLWGKEAAVRYIVIVLCLVSIVLDGILVLPVVFS